MDLITVDGINWIIAIQSLGNWLEMPMRFFTFLGSENFFFLVLPLIYWSIDPKLGLQVGLILATSNSLKEILKMAFALPRPYWVSADVTAMAAEGSFGIPSGHAQNAASMWGVMAYGIRKPWAWIAAIAIIFLVGFSRLYLGVHFVWDVVVGWLLGGLILLLFVKLWDPVSRWIASKTLPAQIAIAFLISLILIALHTWQVMDLADYVLPPEWIENALRAGEQPDPVAIEGILTSAGSLFGLAAGAAWIASRGGYDASGPLDKRALRYAIGLIGILILWMGLGQVFPREANLISYILRYARYSFVGFWVTAGAPWLFFHFRLASRPNM